MMLEEAYEVVEAIDEGDDEELIGELGDLLLQVVFHSQERAPLDCPSRSKKEIMSLQEAGEEQQQQEDEKEGEEGKEEGEEENEGEKD